MKEQMRFIFFNFIPVQVWKLQTQLQLNFNFTSSQPQPQFSLTSTSNSNQPQLQPQLNPNSIWLWHKSNPILFFIFCFYCYISFIMFCQYNQTKRKTEVEQPLCIWLLDNKLARNCIVPEEEQFPWELIIFKKPLFMNTRERERLCNLFYNTLVAIYKLFWP